MIKNIEWVKITNMRKIIGHACQVDDFSKRDLSDELGLSFATVSTLVNLLEDHDMLEDVPAAPTGSAGRSAKRYRFRKDSLFFLVISLSNRSLVTMVLVDLRRASVARTQFVLETNAASPVDQMYAAYERLLDESGVTDESVIALGVSIQGSYNRQSDVLNAPLSKLLNGAHLRTELEKRFGKAVTIQNDIDAAAIYMAHQMRRDYLVYIYLNWHIGTGVVVGGRLLSGYRGQTPEISHIPLGDISKTCPLCGADACLSNSLSKGAMLEKYFGRSFRPLPEGYETEWQQFTDAVKRKEPEAMAIVQEKAQLLAKLIVVLFSICGVNTAVISGIPETLYQDMYPYLIDRLGHWINTCEVHQIAFDPNADQTILSGTMDAAFRRWYPDFANGKMWTDVGQEGVTPPREK